MKYLKNIAFVFFIPAIFYSCNRGRLNVDVSNINIGLEIKRLDKSLFELDTTDIKTGLAELKKEYGEFFDIFTYKMISIGGANTPGYYELAKKFITDTMILNVKKMVDSEFKDFSETGKSLDNAFRHYKYYFPGKDIPAIYTCISGFNQSVVVAKNIIGLSLDNYLGPDCLYYSRLGLPQYKQQKMYKGKIAADAMYAWGATEFEKKGEGTHLLDYMIHEGKLMYFLDAMLPDVHDSVKIGYTKKQLEWCKDNEAQMWDFLVENKKLYISGRMDIKRIIGDAPYTNGFPIESPGKAGVWVGWQIVRQFMEKNPDVTLPELMEMEDSQGILNASAYFPEPRL
ncbi:hypothetical protein MNBD_BACTEROID01-1004 [hydrothermal vent metagenome]|uniref:Uncharacterized protein n=1 Tax=hydrothermal vent metagenome TaxID=652676 RepID=A0A3B0U995_9ZZZZ